jgi:hypothetical protein
MGRAGRLAPTQSRRRRAECVRTSHDRRECDNPDERRGLTITRVGEAPMKRGVPEREEQMILERRAEPATARARRTRAA